MFEFGGGLSQLVLECAIEERRAMRDDRRAGIRYEFAQLADAERGTVDGREGLRRWVGSVARSARTLAWAVFAQTPSDTPA